MKRQDSEYSCDEVQERLWPLDRPRETVVDEAELRAHLDQCKACEGFFARDAAISRVLRDHSMLETAPEHLWERVFDALARERARTPVARAASAGRGHWLVTRGAPFAAAAAVAGLAVGMWSSARASDNAAIVDDFLSHAVEAKGVGSPEATTVSRFFEREIGVPIVPVALEDASVSRAMICMIKGERAAMVEYRVDGMTVAHYRMPRGEDSRTIAEPRRGTAEGVQVVRWTDDRFEHALVSALPADRLEGLVRTRFLTS